MDLIRQLEQEEMKRLGATIPPFAPGDTVVVSVNVKEGDRKRLQAYEGVVVGKRNRGLNSSFTVRKISSGEGVERTFQTYSPLIAAIEVKRKGDVRRAKLYYLRDRSGKGARIREKLAKQAEVLGGEEILAAAPGEGAESTPATKPARAAKPAKGAKAAKTPKAAGKAAADAKKPAKKKA